MEIIENWDFMGWKETMSPDVGVQLTWNRTLMTKIMLVSNKIHQHSRRYNADTITVHPSIEGLLHPDFYDDHRKLLMNQINVVFDESMDKNLIEIKSIRSLEQSEVIPELSEDGMMITFTHRQNLSEEKIIEYLSGLIGFVVIENLTAV